MGKKKVKVKVKRRRLNIKKVIKLLLFLLVFYYIALFIVNTPIKNIYVIGNDNISDYDIISSAKIADYPSFFLTTSKQIRKNILNNPFIKNVKITKKLGNKLYLKIEEYKILCLDKNSNKLYLENGNKVDNNYDINYVPILINGVYEISNKFIAKFSLIEENIILKISEIEYSPVDVDKERFLLKMVDGNYVYITLSKIKKINKYDTIYDELDGKKGIIYLDSGNYVEIKEG